MLERKSLGCFSEENQIRVYALNFIMQSHYEYVFNIFVLLASIVIACKDSSAEIFENDQNLTIGYINFGFTVVFLVDSILKIVAQGLWMHPESYLRNKFQVLDCFLVIAG